MIIKKGNEMYLVLDSQNIRDLDIDGYADVHLSNRNEKDSREGIEDNDYLIKIEVVSIKKAKEKISVSLNEVESVERLSIDDIEEDEVDDSW